jgi:hypothetical protein
MYNSRACNANNLYLKQEWLKIDDFFDKLLASLVTI